MTVYWFVLRSEDSRVIAVSGAGMLRVKLDPHDLNFENMTPYDGMLAWCQTKRQQVCQCWAGLEYG